ncbi:IS630 family transposase [Blautia sp. HCP3S3_C12]|uniref:IS630 family transposase n=1 Tax=unclassified Blautia TaxID=2648079 RepID=UPI003F891ABA
MKNTFLPLSDEDKKYLKSLSKTRTIQAQVVDRARILLYKADGVSFDDIAARLNISKRTVRLCISKFNNGGLDAALFDAKRSGRPAEVSDDAKAWIINLACQRPADLGYSQELWTLAKLHKHIQQHAQQAGFPRLTTITKAYVQKLLQDNQIKPFKIKYYCEKRDPDFESKMHEVLVVYKQVEMQFDEKGNIIVPDDYRLTITVSYDEKPGIQAIANTSEDLRPTGDNGEVYRDYEYKRLGTVSLLAGIDLLTGEAIPLVRDTHKSSDFIDFLKILDKKYPSQDTIRIILDNHSAHTSKETKRFLATMPKERFEFVFTPKHGSWLNMIEGFFGKMTKQMLRGIRVNSKQELVDRIYQYFDEINKEPVVYHWKYKMDDIEETESASV